MWETLLLLSKFQAIPDYSMNSYFSVIVISDDDVDNSNRTAHHDHRISDLGSI